MTTTAGRGYGGQHQRERRRWVPIVAAGEVDCCEVECLLPGVPLDPDPSGWDLAHDDEHPGLYLGPAHPLCNRSKAGRKARGTLTVTPPRRWVL